MKTAIYTDIMFIFEDDKTYIDVFFEAYDKLKNSNAKLQNLIQDVDYSPVAIYTLNGEEFALRYDPMVDPYIECSPKIIKEIEKLLLE